MAAATLMAAAPYGHSGIPRSTVDVSAAGWRWTLFRAIGRDGDRKLKVLCCRSIENTRTQLRARYWYAIQSDRSLPRWITIDRRWDATIGRPREKRHFDDPGDDPTIVRIVLKPIAAAISSHVPCSVPWYMHLVIWNLIIYLFIYLYLHPLVTNSS